MSRNEVVVFALLLLFFTGQTIQAARVSLPKAGKSIITADAGAFRRNGENISVVCERNVRMTSVDSGSTLICQRLDADAEQNKVTTVQATGGAKFTMYVTLEETPGHPVEYQVDVTAQSALKVGNVIRLKGGKDRSQPQLTMIPVDNTAGDKVTLTADVIEFYPDAGTPKDTDDRSVPFMLATGNARFDAQKSVAGSMKQVIATAARIAGVYENISGAKDGAYTQLFRFERGPVANGDRPHLDIHDLKPGAPDSAVLDADSITFYPSAEQVWMAGAGQTAVAMLTADGSVKFNARRTTVERTTPPAAKTVKASPLSTPASLPAKQIWQGEAERISYQLERSEGERANGKPGYDYVFRMSRGHGRILSRITLLDGETKKRVSEMTSDQAFVNVDSGEWGLISDDEGSNQ